MSDLEPVEFAPLRGGRALVYVGRPLLAAVAIGSFFSGVVSLGLAIEQDDIAKAAVGLICLGFACWFSGSLFVWVRHAHAYGTRYRLTEDGVWAERDEQRTLVRRAQIEQGRESRVFRYIELYGPPEVPTLVLQFGQGGLPARDPGQKLCLARERISAAIGERFQRRWLFM